MIKDLRYMSFEVFNGCNLDRKHDFCPVNDPERYPACEGYVKCPDEDIVRFATHALKKRGFGGLIGFHYYCDPLMNIPRMLKLMKGIKEHHEAARFILWTNGLLLKSEHRAWLSGFDRIVVTLHEPSKEKQIREAVGDTKNVHIADAIYDDRIKVYDSSEKVARRCIRPSQIELPVNYYGWIRLCCGDYRGQVSLGNISQEKPDLLMDYFEEAAQEVEAGTPEICKKCNSLTTNPSAVV